MVGTIEEILVYPIKSGHRVSVPSAVLTPTGLQYDRAWCVVDLEGTRFPEREYISQRKLPKMATVVPTFSADGATLHIDAPGMSRLSVPTAEADYASNAPVKVECCGVSTTGGGGWHLGAIDGFSAGDDAARWFTEYLNRPEVVKSSKPPAKYALVRSMTSSVRPVHTFAGPKQQLETFDHRSADVRDDDAIRYQDFAPLLLTNKRSVDHLNEMMTTRNYPIYPFRGNLVVDGDGPAWDEETWRDFSVGGTKFRFLKECPRCSVPGRDQKTGEFHFKGGGFDGVTGKLLHVQNTLKKAFPAKADDDSWLSWKGPFFGIYIAPTLPPQDARVTISVGDEVTVSRRSKGGGLLSMVANSDITLDAMIIAASIVMMALFVNQGVLEGYVPSLAI